MSSYDLLNGAPQSVHVSNATETYLIIDSVQDGSLTLEIHPAGS
jgi:hypothetical protein